MAIGLFDFKATRELQSTVPLPEDPVTGGAGYLQPLWKNAALRDSMTFPGLDRPTKVLRLHTE